MQNTFGDNITARRAELRLTLRDCAIRAGIDPGNLSKIERGRLSPPQNDGLLARLVEALELKGTEEGQRLIDVAAVQNGRIPTDIAQNAALVGALPILLRAVNSRGLGETQLARILEMIRHA